MSIHKLQKKTLIFEQKFPSLYLEDTPIKCFFTYLQYFDISDWKSSSNIVSTQKEYMYHSKFRSDSDVSLQLSVYYVSSKNATTFFEYDDFWPAICLILYPSLENLTTSITISNIGTQLVMCSHLPKGPSLYYVRVFWSFFVPPTYLCKDIFTT